MHHRTSVKTGKVSCCNASFLYMSCLCSYIVIYLQYVNCYLSDNVGCVLFSVAFRGLLRVVPENMSSVAMLCIVSSVIVDQSTLVDQSTYMCLVCMYV